MRQIETKIENGDCLAILKQYPDNFFDLIVTSPPYADSRSKTYGGIKPNNYVGWFLPRAKEFLRVLKPNGTFILNIKEKAANGERHTYVLELILSLREQGWLWTEEFVWHKKIVFRENGLTGLGMRGSDACNLTNLKNSICIKMKSWFLWANGPKRG